MVFPKWLWISSLFLIFSFVGFGQERISQDSISSMMTDTLEAKKYLNKANIFIDSLKYKEALVLNKKALRIYQNTVGEKDILTARAYNFLSKSYYYNKQLDSSIEAASRGLELSIKCLGENNLIEAYSYHLLGKIWRNKGNYDKSIEHYEKELKIYTQVHGEIHRKVADACSNLGIALDNKGSLDKALQYYERALDIWIPMFGKDYLKVADTYSNIGIVWMKKEAFDLALQYYEKALEIKVRKLGENHLGVAQVYDFLGILWFEKSDFNKALMYYQKALDIKIRELGENHVLAGRTYNNLGVLFKEKGDFNEAIFNYEKALKIFTYNYSKTHPFIASINNNIGNLLLDKGDSNKALVYLEEALRSKISTFGKTHFSVAKTYNNIGEVWREKGDYDKALLYYDKALVITVKLAGQDHLEVARSYYNMGNLWIDKRNSEKALMYYKKALAIRIKKLGENHTNVASIYGNMGVALRRQGKLDEALMHHKKALAIKTQTLGKDSPLLSITYNNISKVLNKKKEFDKSFSTLEKVLELTYLNYGEKHPFTAMIYLNIGQVWNKKKNYIKAYQSYIKASKIINYNFESPAFFSNVSDLSVLQVVFLSFEENFKNKFQESKNAIYLDSLKSNYQKMIALEEFIQEKYSGLSIRKFYTTQSIPVYEEAISNLYLRNNQYELPEAFLYAEKTKSRLLSEKIKSEKLYFSFEIPDSLIDKEHDLSVNISYYEKKRFQEEYETRIVDNDLLNIYKDTVFQLRNEQEYLVEYFKNNFPKYYKAKYDLSTISLEEVKYDLLQKNQSLIEYMVGDKNIYIFLVQKDTFEVHEIKHDFPLEDWIKDMTRDGIYGYHTKAKANQNEALETSTIASYTTAAQKIYEKLIAPVAHLLKKEVLIIPDGVLGYIPFEALLTEEPPREGVFRAYPYLIKKHQISYCYSATLLNEMRNKRHKQNSSGKLLAMAPFYKDNVEELVSNLDTTNLLVDITLRDSLKALRGSGEEVATINTLWKGTSVYGANASLKRFQENAANYQIIHLSTHGKADDRIGDYAYLAFSNPYKKNTFDKLFARDLYDYSLNADMVVLSACETGTGKLQKGEGIISLARAFAYAGAKSIFSTLWKVNDEKTKDLMVYFYTNLKKGQEKDEALRKAKLKYLKKNRGDVEALHPFFWAGLIGVGDMSPIRFK